jgi:hypothetical protein
MAASLMKSSVFGAIPSAELTPVFSPTDWKGRGGESSHYGECQDRFLHA